MKKYLIALFALAALGGYAADIFVDYNTGKNRNSGAKDAPLANVDRALQLAKPGDTIYILPSDKPICASIRLQNISGTPDKPITVDGMNNIFIGAVPLDPKVWKEVKPGLYSKTLKTGRNWTSRYYMVIDGKMNRMGRISKASAKSAPYKKVEELAPGEWTIVRGAEVPSRGVHKQYNFEYFVRLPEGATLADGRVLEPMRTKTEGVMVRGTTSNVIVKNIIVKNFHNDGYNIHGQCRNVHFENVASVYCGDDGISAHEACTISLKNAVFIGCSTAICHVQQARCTHENVYAEKINGRELFFTASTHNDLKNIFFLGNSASGCLWIARDKNDVQTGKVENIVAVCNNPRAIFTISGKGNVNVNFDQVQVTGYAQTAQRPGITVAAKNDLLKKIAAAKTELFAIFGGNLEKALQNTGY